MTERVYYLGSRGPGTSAMTFDHCDYDEELFNKLSQAGMDKETMEMKIIFTKALIAEILKWNRYCTFFSALRHPSDDMYL